MSPVITAIVWVRSWRLRGNEPRLLKMIRETHALSSMQLPGRRGGEGKDKKRRRRGLKSFLNANRGRANPGHRVTAGESRDLGGRTGGETQGSVEELMENATFGQREGMGSMLHVISTI